MSHQAPVEAEPSRLKVIATVSFYMVAALIVTVNKWVLIKSPVPVLFIAAQALIATVMVVITKQMGWIKYTTSFTDMQMVKDLWKLIAINAASLMLGNFTLYFLDASFYQVARGLILPITIAMAYHMQSSPPSRGALIGCTIVTIGFFVGALGNYALNGGLENGVTFIGLLFGIAGSFATAYHAILIKQSLTVVQGSTMDLMFYSNAYAVIILLPLSVITGEMPALMKLLTGQEPLGRMLWGTLVTGLVGFLIGIAGLLSVKVTSPVTHMTSSAARGVLQTLAGAWFFGEILTGSRIASIFIIIVGSCYYIYVKHSEQQAKTAPKAEYHQLEQLEEGGKEDAEDHDEEIKG